MISFKNRVDVKNVRYVVELPNGTLLGYETEHRMKDTLKSIHKVRQETGDNDGVVKSYRFMDYITQKKLVSAKK